MLRVRIGGEGRLEGGKIGWRSTWVRGEWGEMGWSGQETSAWIVRDGDPSAAATPPWGRFRRERGVRATDWLIDLVTSYPSDNCNCSYMALVIHMFLIGKVDRITTCLHPHSVIMDDVGHEWNLSDVAPNCSQMSSSQELCIHNSYITYTNSNAWSSTVCSVGSGLNPSKTLVSLV